MDIILNLCNDNNLKEIKNYLKNNKDFDLHMCDEEIFRYCCKKGFLEITKFLFKYSNKINSPIDIHIKNDNAFSWACCNGHLNIAKWLWRISKNNINFRANNDYAFLWSCRSNHIETAIWLAKKCSEYEIEIKNNEIKNYFIKNIFTEIKNSNNNFDTLKNLFKKTKNIKINNKSCVICMGNNNKMINTNCKINDKYYNHYYCAECFAEWYTKKDSKKCLYCNQEINQKKCIFVYEK
jgi:hypothetical protein